jgi:hypothetical protein
MDGSRARAREAGVPHTVSLQNIKELITDVCPVLGTKLVYDPGRGRCRPDTPTVDRIVPELGYVPGNIAVISFRANRIKCDATADELFKVASWISQTLQHYA